MRSLSKQTVVTLLGLSVLWCPEAAQARPEQHKAPSAKPVNCQVIGDIGNTFKVVGPSGTCVVPVYKWTQITLPRGTTSDDEKPPGFEFRHDMSNGVVDIGVQPDTPVGTETLVKVRGPRQFITLVIYAVSSDKITHRGWTLLHESEAEARAKKDATDAKQQLSAVTADLAEARSKAATAEREAQFARSQTARTKRMLDAERLQHKQRIAALEIKLANADAKVAEAERKLEEHQEQATREVHRARAKGVVAGDEQRRNQTLRRIGEGLRGKHLLAPIKGYWPNAASGIAVRFLFSEWVGNDVVIPLDIDASKRNRPLQLTGVRAVDAAGNERAVDIIDPPRPEDQERGIITSIPPGGRGHLTVTLRLQPGDTPDAFKLELREASSMKAIVAPILMRPIGPNELRRERQGKQFIVGVRAMYGAFWIADGQGADRLDSTSFQGLGLRVVKGFNENWAVEAEVSGGTTGTARFAGMTIDGSEGELTRSASFGRAGFGGLLRFGDKVNPYLRAGLAGQAAKFDAAFTGAADMDESSFEFSMLLTAGGGVDVRLSDNLLAGVALSAETPVGGEGKLFGNAVSLGAHVAYGW